MRKRKNRKNGQSPVLPGADQDENIRRKQRLIRQLKHDAAIKIMSFAAVVCVTFTFIFGIASAPTNDMYPAIHEGDLMIYYRPGRLVCSDVVVYESSDSKKQIGRVEGTAGETVGRTESGLLTVNGNIQPIQKRCGLYEETYAGGKDIYGEIKDGYYLILGDSRETARDSREFGLIPKRSVKGKVFTIIRRRPL